MVDPSHPTVICLLNYFHFQSCAINTLPKMYCDGYPLNQSPHYYKLTADVQTQCSPPNAQIWQGWAPADIQLSHLLKHLQQINYFLSPCAQEHWRHFYEEGCQSRSALYVKDVI